MNYSSVYFLNIKQSHIILVVIDLLCYEGLITKECRYKWRSQANDTRNTPTFDN